MFLWEQSFRRVERSWRRVTTCLDARSVTTLDPRSTPRWPPYCDFFNLPQPGKIALKGRYDLFIVRIAYLPDGTMYYQNARPCKHCLDILKLYGVRRAYYTVHSPPGSINFYMERVTSMVSTHVSSGIRNMCDREYRRRDYRLV